MFMNFLLNYVNITIMANMPPLCPEMVTREQWGARPPKDPNPMTLPVPFVVIHHTYLPGFCSSSEQCAADMRSMQRYHQDEHKWSDIGYSFAIGGDGKVYEGRGWGLVGAHAPRYNNRSIGIVFIGDFRTMVPTDSMLVAARSLIACGVSKGMVKPDYKLLGHRQVRSTECPGGALYQLIQGWSHWDPIIDIPKPS